MNILRTDSRKTIVGIFTLYYTEGRDDNNIIHKKNITYNLYVYTNKK
jgi:hypothetical protein